MFENIKGLWNNLGIDGIEAIDSFEKRWCEWSVDDTIEWFEFVLSQDSEHIYDNDYEIEDYNSSDSSDDDNDEEEDDEKQHVRDREVTELIDFKQVRSYLCGLGFNTKKDLPILVKSFQFERFGFKNKNDCKLLCKKTKGLVKKYPRKSNKSKKKNKTRKNQKENVMSKRNDVRLEGFIDDTN